jgi:two-component system, NtrC family, sensor kinase
LPKLRLSLIAKLAVSTSLVLLVFMALFAYFNIETLKKIFLEEAISDADKLSDAIIKTTHYQMLEDDRQRAYQMIQEVGTQKGIEIIRLINKDGRIIFSTQEHEIGTFIDKTAAACNMCHAGTTPLIQASTMNRSRIFPNKDGKQVLGLAKAIYNEESCYTAQCHFHPHNFRVLGVLDVVVSLDNMTTLVSSYRNKFISMTLFLILLIWLSITLCTQALVSQPVKQLLTHTNLLARGELNSTVPTYSSDELGELATAFNTMTISLKKARDELEDWGRNLEFKVEERTRQLKQIQDQLVRSEKLASLGELVAGIAHEINNPLTGILVFASLLEKNQHLDPATKSDLALISRECQRCASIVRGLLEFSRESVPHKDWVSLNDIMDASVALVQHQSSFHDITIVKEYDVSLPPAFVDANQIQQVLVNILLNASHAMPQRGELRIVSGIDSASSIVYVSISDTGHGIPEENMKKIFDPFFTTKENSGTGLGLSVSYGIISSHGGKIEVQSSVGVGTTFTVKLPIGAEQCADKDNRSQEQRTARQLE